MRYSIEPRDKIDVKGYGFLSFKKIWVKIIAVSMDKNFLTPQKRRQQDNFKKGDPKNSRSNWGSSRKKSCRQDYKGCIIEVFK